jgi:hypothetical protein
MPPSTKVAPPDSTSAISRVVAGDTALPST